MKLYRVKPDYLYGEEKEKRQFEQDAILFQMGLELTSMGEVICTAEEALGLMNAGFCGDFINPKESIKLIEVKIPDPYDLTALIQGCIAKTMEEAGKLFNEKCSVEQPGPALMDIGDTKLMEDACTDALQENLNDGWRILAVCPQPQRRPDYILGKPQNRYARRG